MESSNIHSQIGRKPVRQEKREMTTIRNEMSQLDNPHLVCVTETWFGNNSAPHIKGYHLHSRCRGRRGVGVCIYVRDDICSMEVMDTQPRG